MKFEYKGFVLELGLVTNCIGNTAQGGYCEELKYMTQSGSREKDITNFINYIDHHPIAQYKAKEKDNQREAMKKEVEEIIKLSEYNYEDFVLQVKVTSSCYQIAECKEIGFYMKSGGSLDNITQEFKKAVDVVLEDKKKKDEDLFLVETFIEKLSLINKEMELLRDNPHKHLVLDVKLGKLYEKAKDVFHLSSYESFKTYYNMKFPNK